MCGNPIRSFDPRGLNPAAGALEGAEVGTALFPSVSAVVGVIVDAGVGLYIADKAYDAIISNGVPIQASRYAPRFVDPVRRAKEWGERNHVPNAVDIFYDIKKAIAVDLALRRPITF